MRVAFIWIARRFSPESIQITALTYISAVLSFSKKLCIRYASEMKILILFSFLSNTIILPDYTRFFERSNQHSSHTYHSSWHWEAAVFAESRVLSRLEYSTIKGIDGHWVKATLKEWIKPDISDKRRVDFACHDAKSMNHVRMCKTPFRRGGINPLHTTFVCKFYF